MSPRARSVLRGAVIAAGSAVTVAGLCLMRLEDWPIYATYVLLSIALFEPWVDVRPGLGFAMPGLALTIGFLYIGGLPILALRNAAPLVARLLRAVLPPRWRAYVPRLIGSVGEFITGPVQTAALPRAMAAADWSGFNIGLGVRWAIVVWLVKDGRPASDLGAVALAEAGGYLFWTFMSTLPVFSFPPVLPPAPDRRARSVLMDMGLIMVGALTPFVFLIVYGYRAHGLPGAAAWSFSALGLHFILKRLNERRVLVEEQNRRLEALNRELRHRERLSAIGKMSSVISHQMLQQLGVIGLYADLIRHADGGEEPAATVATARRNAVAIEDALAGINRVLTDLLVFSRDLRLNLYEHPVRRVLEESVEECDAQAAARRVRLRLDCPDAVTAVFDKLKIKQAVVNVLRNAVDASPVGEEVILRAGLRDGAVEVTVTDRGPGVAADQRETVFVPFFTTKEGGTGLGLAIAREFVEAHGGRIVVAGGERPAAGATFVLSVPLQGPPAER
jgi:signal transduction histidine kinase